jgi:hypothetical protein
MNELLNVHPKKTIEEMQSGGGDVNDPSGIQLD